MGPQLQYDRKIQRALDIVEKHLERTELIYERCREHRRQRVHKRLHVFPCGRQDQPPLEAWSYEVSRSGAGFVCESELDIGTVLIGFDLDSESPIWMNAVVRHCKEVMDGVHACGVQFQGRSHSPD